MGMKSLQEQVKESREVFEENKKFYFDNACLLFDEKTSIILNEGTFIDLLNDGATKLELKRTATYGGAEHYEYCALYHGRKIGVVTENKIWEI